LKTNGNDSYYLEKTNGRDSYHLEKTNGRDSYHLEKTNGRDSYHLGKLMVGIPTINGRDSYQTYGRDRIITKRWKSKRFFYKKLKSRKISKNFYKILEKVKI